MNHYHADCPEKSVFALLKEKGMTLSAAESCTGGLIAARITELPGSSAVFKGGVVSYTNEVKAGVLGVGTDLLTQYGAVSEPVARAMAEGCRRITGSHIGVSVTGVAGPDRDDWNNPVGTVFIALAAEGGTVCQQLDLRHGSDRGEIRRLAADRVFDLILQTCGD